MRYHFISSHRIALQVLFYSMQNIQIIIKSPTAISKKIDHNVSQFESGPLFLYRQPMPVQFSFKFKFRCLTSSTIRFAIMKSPIPSRRLIFFQNFYFFKINFFLLAVLPGGLLLPCTVTSAPMYVWIQHCVSSHRGLQREDFQREEREKKKKQRFAKKKRRIYHLCHIQSYPESMIYLYTLL